MTRHVPAHEVELYRDDDAYVVYVELPDYDPQDIEVRLDDHRLHVTADNCHSDSKHCPVYHRSLGLPHVSMDSHATASYEDGVLVVTVPVADEHTKPGRVIPIEN